VYVCHICEVFGVHELSVVSRLNAFCRSSPCDPIILNKVFAMRRGVVGIRGVKSGLYLCMSEDGVTYGHFSDKCLFKESLEDNHYTTYSSLSHPGNYLAISHRGRLNKGNGVGPNQSSTHFLPRSISC
uniref:Fibroblast growth factor n=1 Tax=Fundulus heteroclitus TaxID=8078 RepID=A0A3Q2U987_FUNHE